jgi:Ricin-type beta-trefoil lectin domain
MKRVGKIAAMLAAAGLAGALTIGWTGTARADVVPQPPWSEIVNPYTNQLGCLDDPNGSATAHTPVQMFHCHGYAGNGAPQRWIFAIWPNSTAPGIFLSSIQSHNLCLGPNGTSGAGTGIRIALISCGTFLAPHWDVLSRNAYSGDPDFLLEFADTGYCMALPDFSGGNGEPLVFEPCNMGDELQHWNLG